MFTEMVLEAIRKAERGEPVDIPYGDWGTLIHESFVNYNAKEGTQVAKRPEVRRVRAVLVSGGLDSTVAYYMARGVSELDQVPVRAYYGLIKTGYQNLELKALQKIGIVPEIIELPVEHDWDRWGYIIPGRNLLFIMAVAERMNKEGLGGEIWMASLDGEYMAVMSDKSMTFKQTLNRILGALPYPIELKTPMIEMTKTDLVRWWMRRGLPLEKLLQTRTCQSDTEEHCGRCQACFNRWVGLANNGIAHLQVFESQPWKIPEFNITARKKVEEAIKIEQRGYALATEEQSYKSAMEILNALRSVGVGLGE